MGQGEDVCSAHAVEAGRAISREDEKATGAMGAPKNMRMKRISVKWAVTGN